MFLALFHSEGKLYRFDVVSWVDDNNTISRKVTPDNFDAMFNELNDLWMKAGYTSAEDMKPIFLRWIE